MQVAIVKYNAGNIFSVVNALRRLGIDPLLTDSAEELLRADRVLFPGQGEARGAMEYLRARRLDEVIRTLRQPVLGICVGQQLLCRHSEEGDVDCIGIFDAEVKRFRPQQHADKVPCMGWNRIVQPKAEVTGCKTPCALFRGLPSFGNDDSDNSDRKGCDGYAYFVHSYYVPICPQTAAVADYILPYSAALHQDNFYACQFHPEKSGTTGETILKNFLEL